MRRPGPRSMNDPAANSSARRSPCPPSADQVARSDHLEVHRHPRDGHGLRQNIATALGRVHGRHNAPPHIQDGKVMDTRDRAGLDAYARRVEIAREIAKITNDALARASKTTHGQIKVHANSVFRARCRARLRRLVSEHSGSRYQAWPRRSIARQTDKAKARERVNQAAGAPRSGSATNRRRRNQTGVGSEWSSPRDGTLIRPQKE